MYIISHMHVQKHMFVCMYVYTYEYNMHVQEQVNVNMYTLHFHPSWRQAEHSSPDEGDYKMDLEVCPCSLSYISYY
jgi:hypothetical protein